VLLDQIIQECFLIVVDLGLFAIVHENLRNAFLHPLPHKHSFHPVVVVLNVPTINQRPP
jgi:hypothetical protein